MKPFLLSLLLFAPAAHAVETGVLDNGAPFYCELDPRPATEHLFLHFDTGSGGIGAAGQGVLPAFKRILGKALEDRRRDLLHLDAQWRMDWDPRSITIQIIAPPDGMADALPLVSGLIRKPPLDGSSVQAGLALARADAVALFSDPTVELRAAALRDAYGKTRDFLDGQAAPEDIDALSPAVIAALLPRLFDPSRLSYGAAGPAGVGQVRTWLAADAARWEDAKPYQAPKRALPAALDRPRGVLARILRRPGQATDCFYVLVPDTLPTDPVKLNAERLCQRILGDQKFGTLVTFLRREKTQPISIRMFSGPSDWGIAGQVDPKHLADLLLYLPDLVKSLNDTPPNAAEAKLQIMRLDAAYRRDRSLPWERMEQRLRDLSWYGNGDIDDKAQEVLPNISRGDILTYARTLSLVNSYLCLSGDPVHLHSVLDHIDWIHEPDLQPFLRPAQQLWMFSETKDLNKGK